MKKDEKFEGLEGIWKLVNRLRAPDGCPWDREQTNQSLRYDLIEEAYEVLDAIEREDDRSLMEELGDIIFLALMHTKIAEDENRFSLDDVTKTIINKMIERHPHVFGDKKFKDQNELLENWEKTKQKKKKRLFDGIVFSMPALLLAQRVGERARRVGFDWPNIDGVVEKVKEELNEFIQAQKEGDSKRAQEEFGDLLFSLVNLARHLNIDAEGALRQTVRKFVRRFEKIEDEAERQGRTVADMTLEEADQIWERAKEKENVS